MKITVLSPHRDDAAFSVGLAVETWLDAGQDVEVVNCFTESEYIPFAGANFDQQRDRQTRATELRHLEDVRWSHGYSHPVKLIDLHLSDAPQRLQCSVDSVCALSVSPDDPAISAIRSAQSQRLLEALVLPLAIGNHVDHLTARIAAQGAIATTLPVAFYEDLPYAARPGAAAGIEERAENLASGLKPVFVCQATDVSIAVAKKRHMALLYASQIDEEATEQICKFCERYGGRERLWVNSAWLAADLGNSQ